MMSSQCCLPSKVGVEGELISMKSLSAKIFKQGTAILLTVHWLLLSKAQSSHGLNTLVTWIPRALAVAWVMILEGCLSSMCRSLMIFLQGVVADCAHSSCISHRHLTPATQPSGVLIQQSRMILPLIELTTMLFWGSLEILFPSKSLHIRENMSSPALGQNFMGHRMCTHLVRSTC